VGGKFQSLTAELELRVDLGGVVCSDFSSKPIDYGIFGRGGGGVQWRNSNVRLLRGGFLWGGGGLSYAPAQRVFSIPNVNGYLSFLVTASL